MPRHAPEAGRQIFISYRRSDSQPWTGRLADDLRDRFGPDQIYRDLYSNRPGQDYVRQLQEALEGSRVVIVVVGPHWLSSTHPDGRRRLDDPEDPVRLEIERSLDRGVAIVPVLVGNGTMPRAGELPTSLQTLARLQAQRLSDEDWAYDFGRLLETLERHGVVPWAGRTEPAATKSGTDKVVQALETVRRYERTLHSSRRGAYNALLGTVELLRYSITDRDPRAAQITFKVWKGPVTAKVVDEGPGRCKVVLEIPDVRTGAAAAGAAIALGLATGGLGFVGGLASVAGYRVLQRRFAVGFLNNVQRVLEGRGIERDSALLPGVHEWRNRSREV